MDRVNGKSENTNAHLRLRHDAILDIREVTTSCSGISLQNLRRNETMRTMRRREKLAHMRNSAYIKNSLFSSGKRFAEKFQVPLFRSFKIQINLNSLLLITLLSLFISFIFIEIS